MIINRPELEKDLESGKWLLVYGRRKTGKTFLVSNFMGSDSFYFIKRDRTVISKKDFRTLHHNTMMELVRRDIQEGRTVVIDEFHRLGPGFLDMLHSMEITGRLVLISSTLYLSKSMVSGSSPVLGKVTEIVVPLLSYLDLLLCIEGRGKEFYEHLAFRKEPLVLALGYKDPVDAVKGSILTVPALIGEIFSEEDRKLSNTYEGVLRSIAVGRQTSGEISSYLYSRRLIQKDDPSLVQQYLANLVELGIIARFRMWGMNRFVYRHISPLAWAFYCLDERYNISERELGRNDIRPHIQELIPHIMEEVLRNALAKITGTEACIDHSPDGEVDGILVRHNRPVAVVEVKWKSRIKKQESERIREKLMAHDVGRRILIVPDRDMIDIDGVEVIEPRDILSINQGL